MSADCTIKHIVIEHKENCCGCTACYATCPKNAIEMVADEKGFRYPRVNEAKCVDCGLCLARCPIKVGNQHEETNAIYAVKHTLDDIRAESSSGGIFSAIAQNITESNGVVYGAAFDHDFTVRHVRTGEHTWKKLRGAKYVQSDMGDIYSQVKADLNAGLPVLFSGTPCQVDGLNQYLKAVNTSKLITCDLVCHGVPSPKIWKEYLKQLTKETGKEIGKVNFRNKEGFGWRHSTLKIESKDGYVLINEPHNRAYFSRLYFAHAILRPSCFVCQYANLHRVGDITIGDYWGVEKHYPELDDDKGISLVMVNTEKGQDMFQKVMPGCQFVSVSKNESLQPNLVAPAEDNGICEMFWSTYRRYGLIAAGKRVGCFSTNLCENLLISGINILGIVFRKIKSIVKNSSK